MKTEKDLENYIRSEAMKRGYEIFKWVAPGKRGVPDDIIFAPFGVATYVEVKHPKGTGKTSPMQERVINKLRFFGHAVYLVASKEDADTMFKHIDHLVSTKKGGGV